MNMETLVDERSGAGGTRKTRRAQYVPRQSDRLPTSPPPALGGARRAGGAPGVVGGDASGDRRRGGHRPYRNRSPIPDLWTSPAVRSFCAAQIESRSAGDG